MVFMIGEALETQLKVKFYVDAFLNSMKFLFNGNFSKKTFINWLFEFYLNKVPCYWKVGFFICKLAYSAIKWWFEVIEFRTCTNKPLISS